jgi:hypothetical protein
MTLDGGKINLGGDDPRAMGVLAFSGVNLEA